MAITAPIATSKPTKAPMSALASTGGPEGSSGCVASAMIRPGTMPVVADVAMRCSKIEISEWITDASVRFLARSAGSAASSERSLFSRRVRAAIRSSITAVDASMPLSEDPRRNSR
jgi:hypothetical protein